MTSPATSKQIAPFFSVAFRPFFLSGSLFSVLAILAWAGVLNAWFSFEPYANSFWWHAHEMLFGFAAAIVTGFLLTAVQNWTGLTSLKGRSLMLLWLLWLAGRLVLAFDFGLASGLIALIDLSFLPVVAFVLGRLIFKVKLWRNLIFVPVIALMTIANILMHWGAISDNPELVNQGNYAMVMLVTLLITVLGGRVFPMFTANGTGTKKVEGIPLLETLTIASTVLIALIYTIGFSLPVVIQAGLLIFSGVCHFVRLVRWRFWVTFKTPLVWSLHLGYLGIPVGFILMGLHYLTGSLQLSTVLHGLTIGAIGSTILAMITRVSLGHTGRKLQAGRLMALAFVLLSFSFIVRVFYQYAGSDYAYSMTMAALLWGLAFGIYSLSFFPKLTTKRL